jgi:hypothetical protein
VAGAEAPTPPSTAALVKASVVAAAGAAAILLTLVLPAEYGVDPLGAGKALGLDVLAPTAASSSPVPPPEGELPVPVQQGSFALYPVEYKVDSRELTLGPYEYVEYKYHLVQNATMLFSWEASGDVLHDFHGDRDGAPPDAAESYDGQPRREADGSFVAPFSGIHGWFWENPGADTITIRLITAGFYSAAHEFHYDGSRQSREVRGLDAIARNDE